MRNEHTTLAVLLGIAGGVLLIWGIKYARHTSDAAEDHQLFTAKVRCQGTADKYAKDNSFVGPDGTQFNSIIVKVDYSSVVHSCVAEVQADNAGFESFTVLDLVTRDVYGGGICKVNDDCDRRKHDIIESLDATFNDAMTGKAKPLRQ